MFQVLNADNRDQMVNVAMSARCLLVGFRYFRQSHDGKFRLLQIMQRDMNRVLNSDAHMFIEGTELRTFFTGFATANQIENPEGWAKDIMFLISPAMWRASEELTLQEALETWAITISAVPSENANHEVWALAVSGNTSMSTEYNRIFERHIAVFDEDSYPEAAFERPEVTLDFRTDWKELLTARRVEQCHRWHQYKAQVEPVLQAASEMVVEMGEAEIRPEENSVDDFDC